MVTVAVLVRSLLQARIRVRRAVIVVQQISYYIYIYIGVQIFAGSTWRFMGSCK